jgi:hypothetical protein
MNGNGKTPLGAVRKSPTNITGFGLVSAARLVAFYKLREAKQEELADCHFLLTA